MDEAKEAEKRQEAIDSDEMPLEFMLKNMRDPANDLQFRAQMAARAAPFCHPQLQAIAHKHLDTDGNAIAPVVNVLAIVSAPRRSTALNRVTVSRPEIPVFRPGCFGRPGASMPAAEAAGRA